MRNYIIQILLIASLAVMLSSIAGCKKKAALQTATPAPQSVPAIPIEQVTRKTETSAMPVTPAELGQPAVKLDGLTWIKGQPVAFETGKIYIVEFWATWCGPCKVSIPHLTEIQKQYKEKGVTVVGISNEVDDIEKVKKFVAGQGDNMNYNVAVDVKGSVMAGYMDAYSQQYIPTAFIVDGGGKVVWHGHPMEDMNDVLPQVIAGTFDAAAYAKSKAEREEQKNQTNTQFLDSIEGVFKTFVIINASPLSAPLILPALFLLKTGD